MYLMFTLKERAEAAIAAGYSKAALARAANVSPSAVSQWLSGNTTSLKASSAAGLSVLTSWNVTWWAEGRGPREASRDMAQAMSQWAVTIPLQDESPRVTWGSMPDEELPEVFIVEVPDNAMADRVKKGYLVKFDRRLKPRADDGVLLLDASGAWHFRAYAPGANGQFAGVPFNKDYERLDSERHGVRVLAVRVQSIEDGRWG